MSFTALPEEVLNVETKEINQSNLNLEINDFMDNDIIIISSGTATGKTRNIAKLCKDLKNSGNYRVLSIVNLITLANEQISTFKKISDIDLYDYQTELNKFGENDGVICINSLYKLNQVEKFNPIETILYIDEVNDLIRALTHNNAMETSLIKVYEYLIYLIKNCKKIILSDATINQNTLNLISRRERKNKTILIKNINKKFAGVDAIRCYEEEQFINEMKECIKNKKYFLFGCDSCRKITEIYLLLVSENKEIETKFKLITSETTFRPTNASIDFLENYIFYSPSITTGVSFVYDEIQTQFIYMTNQPKITPISFYQMSCRTRNMEKLIYYCDEPKPREMRFETLREVEENEKNTLKCNNRLLGLSRATNERDESIIIENTFFKLYCYNEYQDSIFWTDFLKHYQNILEANGFELKTIGKPESKKKKKETKKDLKELRESIKDSEFSEYILKKFNGKENDEIAEDESNKLEKYSILDTRLNLLNITKQEDAELYKEYIMDNYKLKSFFQVTSLFRTSEFIKNKLEVRQRQSYKYNQTLYNKITLLEKFEEHYKISRFGLNYKNLILEPYQENNELYKPVLMEFKDLQTEPEICEDFKTAYLANFSTRKSDKYQYNSSYELEKVYLNMIKHIADNIAITESKKKKIPGTQQTRYHYYLNVNQMKDLMNLACLNNPSLNNYELEIIEKLTGIKPIIKEEEEEENSEIEDYIFSKII